MGLPPHTQSSASSSAAGQEAGPGHSDNYLWAHFDNSVLESADNSVLALVSPPADTAVLEPGQELSLEPGYRIPLGLVCSFPLLLLHCMKADWILQGLVVLHTPTLHLRIQNLPMELCIGQKMS